jgi:hypothetical protein
VDITPEEAQKLFATEFDEPIKLLLHALRHLGYTDEEFQAMLEAMKDLMEVTIDIPPGLTVEQGMPYVYVSDLLTLGGLAVETYKRRHMLGIFTPDGEEVL